MHPIFERLKERKIVQWALAYLAGGWVLYQVLDAFGDPWGVTDGFLRLVQVALVVGFFLAITLAWYHGEQGQQRVSMAEGAILTVILIAGAFTVTALRSETSGNGGDTEPGRSIAPGGSIRVLVVPPTNETGVSGLDAWGVLAADAMNRAVTQHTELEVVATAEARRRFRAGQDVTTNAIVAGMEATGADYALSATYVMLGGEIRVNTDVLGWQEGSVFRTLPAMAFPADSLDKGLALLEQSVGVAAIYLEPYDGWMLRLLSLPRTVEAARLMIRARDAMCAFRQEDAVALAERARDLEPDWPSPYLALRPTLFNLGRDQEWESVYEQALLALLPRMTEFERHSWDFMEGETTEERLRAAVGGFRLTQGHSPFNQGYGVAFRSLQLNYLDLARQGMDTIGDADGPCAVSWTYRWVVDGQLYHLAGDYESELGTLREGRRRFPSEVMLARDELGALAALDQIDDVMAGVELLEAFPAPPDSIWNGLHDVGLELAVHGHTDASRAVLDRLVRWSRSNDLSALQQGHALYLSGRYEEALPFLTDALNDAVTAPALGLTAMTLDQLGRSQEADEHVRRLEAAQDVVFYGDHAPEEFPASRWPTIVAASRGQLDRAVALLREALANGLRYHDLNQMQIHIRPELIPLRDHPAFRELMRPRPYLDDLEG